MRSLRSGLVVLVVVATACTSASEPAAMQVVDGTVQRQTAEGWEDAASLAVGDVVRMTTASDLRSGQLEVSAMAGSELQIRDGSLVLRHGDVVVAGDQVDLSTDDVRVAGVGVFRIHTGVQRRVGVYAGSAEVSRPGEVHRLGPFRQLDLSARRLDGLDDPLSYTAADPFDLRHLAPAIAFDAEVASYVNRLDELYGDAPRPPSFYASFTTLEEGDVDALLSAGAIGDAEGSGGPPAETLVGLFLARALAMERTIDVGEAAQEVASLRAEGARWGLIAMALRLQQVAFAAVVDQAVAVRADSGSDAPRPPAQPTSTGSSAVAAAPPPNGAQPPAGPADLPAAPPPPAPPPDEGIVPGAVQQIIQDVLDAGPLPALTSGG